MEESFKREENSPQKTVKTPSPRAENFLFWVEKNYLFVLGAIIVLFIIAALILFFNSSTNPSQDAYWYMALSKNMFENNSYSLFAGIEHGKYPPGFPALIGIANYLVSDYLLASKLVALICGILTIPLAYLFGKEYGKKTGLLAAFFTAIFFLLLEYSVVGMTETAFGLFALAGLYFTVKLKQGTLRNTSIKQKAGYLLGFVFIGFSTLIRYTGFVTLATVGIMEVIENRKKPLRIIFGGFLAGLILFGVILAPWIIRNETVSQTLFGTAYSSEQYTPFNIDFFAKILNLNIIILLIAAAGVYFYFKQEKRNRLWDSLIIFSILSVLFYFWWGYAMTRFLIVLAIPLAVFLASAVKEVYFKTKSFLIPAVIIVLVLGANLYAFETVDGSYYWNSQNLLNVKDAALWAKGIVPSDAILIVPDVPIYNYYLDRNDYLNVANYNALQIPGVIASPKLYAIADEQHLWVSKALLENDSNVLSVDVSVNGQNIRVLRKFHEIKSFPAVKSKTPLLGIENTSGAVRVFEFSEPQYVTIGK